MESPHIIYDPEHWRSRAKDARRIADSLDDPGARRSMLKIAEEYERLAERAAERAIAKDTAGPEMKPGN
jgi:hypothetical protein